MMQKRVIRCICGEPYDAHTDPLFKELKILKFDDMYLFNLGVFMFLYCNNLLPDPFDFFFNQSIVFIVITPEVHDYTISRFVGLILDDFL